MTPRLAQSTEPAEPGDAGSPRLTVRPDRRYIRTTWRSNRFVLVDLTAPDAPSRAPDDPGGRPPTNLAFVLDRSGSMAGQKIRLARRAVEEGIARLKPEDRFAVVVYDEVIDVVADSGPATAENKRRALDRLAEIDARGNTALAEGWLRGAEQVGLHLAERGVNRVLLVTDGLANVGITSPDELTQHAAGLRARGVATSTFGVGADFDEHLLQAMADAGGGHFYFIESAAQIVDFITSEVGETLEVVARGAALEVTHPDSEKVESLSPFAVTAEEGRTSVALGDLVSGQHLRVVLRLNFPFGEVGREVGATFAMTDQDGAFAHAGTEGTRSKVARSRKAVSADSPGVQAITLRWAYADDRTNDLQERDAEVDRAVARLFAARARAEATYLNREGRFDEARGRIEAVAKRIRGYAGRDPEMREIVARLEAEQPMWSAAMPAMQLKSIHFASVSAARSRDAQGRAQRRS
jgi:Ca-activated chloride channel family protein